MFSSSLHTFTSSHLTKTFQCNQSIAEISFKRLMAWDTLNCKDFPIKLYGACLELWLILWNTDIDIHHLRIAWLIWGEDYPHGTHSCFFRSDQRPPEAVCGVSRQTACSRVSWSRLLNISQRSCGLAHCTFQISPSVNSNKSLLFHTREYRWDQLSFAVKW